MCEGCINMYLNNLQYPKVIQMHLVVTSLVLISHK
jgi:hypothetical protein